MKLYMHPVSMTSRPVRLFIAENGIQVEEQVVDLMTGEHLQPSFAAVNPSKMVPVLEDDGLRLTESSAILKYLADKTNSPAYPKDLKQRAKVNEAMDWFNSNFYRAQIMAGTLGCLGLALVFDLVLLGLGRLLMPWVRRSAS